jgi:hypothetical protein
MNLVYRYYELGIEGIPSSMLQQILEGTHAIKVKVASPGMIMLTTNKVIKCVKEYYNTKEGMKPLKKVSNQCYYVQTGLDIQNVGNYQCAQCHLKCSNMLKEGKLIRKR